MIASPQARTWAMPSAEPEAPVLPDRGSFAGCRHSGGLRHLVRFLSCGAAERLCSVSSAGTIQPPTDRKAAETVGIVTVQSSQSVASGEIETHDVSLAALDSRFASSSLIALRVSRTSDQLIPSPVSSGFDALSSPTYIASDLVCAPNMTCFTAASEEQLFSKCRELEISHCLVSTPKGASWPVR